MELDTWDLNSMHLTVALNFGGRQDIVKAVQTIAKRAALNKLDSFSVSYFHNAQQAKFEWYKPPQTANIVYDSLYISFLPTPLILM